MHVALSRSARGDVTAVELEDDGTEATRVQLDESALAGFVREREAQHPRWIWNDTSTWSPPLLAQDVRVERCVDLRLSHRILRHSAAAAGSELATALRDRWDQPTPE